ncbi:hypothetical protein Hanom_Chr02g00178261 [Helianthus anomalus]
MDCFRSPTRFLISTIVIVLYVSSLQFQYTDLHFVCLIFLFHCWIFCVLEGFDCHFACIFSGFFLLADEFFLLQL